jgi:hypothetical protein
MSGSGATSRNRPTEAGIHVVQYLFSTNCIVSPRVARCRRVFETASLNWPIWTGLQRPSAHLSRSRIQKVSAVPETLAQRDQPRYV